MNRFFTTQILFASFLFGVLTLFSCNHNKSSTDQKVVATTEEGSGPYRVGKCFDKVISPYIFQIAQIEGPIIYYYALGKDDKDMQHSHRDQLFKSEDPYKIIPCP
jgi:hypothetical protein